MGKAREGECLRLDLSATNTDSCIASVLLVALFANLDKINVVSHRRRYCLC